MVNMHFQKNAIYSHGFQALDHRRRMATMVIVICLFVSDFKYIFLGQYMNGWGASMQIW